MLDTIKRKAVVCFLRGVAAAVEEAARENRGLAPEFDRACAIQLTVLNSLLTHTDSATISRLIKRGSKGV